jgi:putative transposase
MRFDPKKHHRRSIRLKDYDYSQSGAYFVTVVTQARISLFGNVNDGQLELNDAGQMVQTCWREISEHYPGVETDVFIVMPNHVHGIIFLVGAGPCACPSEVGQPRGVAPTLSLPDIVQRFKSLTTKRYTEGVRKLQWSSFPARLWQRNYYEHVIRDEESLNRIREYILNNPAQWAFDRENPAATAAEPPDIWRLQERREGRGDRPVAPKMDVRNT